MALRMARTCEARVYGVKGSAIRLRKGAPERSQAHGNGGSEIWSEFVKLGPVLAPAHLRESAAMKHENPRSPDQTAMPLPEKRKKTTMLSRDVEWGFPPATAVLGPEAVHLWCASLDLPKSRIDAFEETLSKAERNKAADLCSYALRRHFIASHGLLRSILARYVPAAPGEIELANDHYGKPRLKGVKHSLSFNMAHSGELAIYAVSERAEVGVDLERIRSVEHVLMIAAQFFSPREQAELHTLSEEDQLYGFFDCWTRKEALIKALGGSIPQFKSGLGIPRNDGGQPTAPLELSHHWCLRSLSPAPGYIAAVAVDSPCPHFSYWRWTDPARSLFERGGSDLPKRFRN